MKTRGMTTMVLAAMLLSQYGLAQITVNGDLSEAQYDMLANKLNGNQGFGPNIDVQRIVYYPDVVNQQLYFGVVGRLNTASNDGIGIWLDFSERVGSPVGTNLGVSGAGHYMGATASAFKADFEVDYMFAINPGSSTANAYVDVARRVAPIQATYLGNCGQAGVAIDGPSGTGGVFSQNSVRFAFNNGGGANHGFEIKIPFAEMGITSAGDIRAFAMVVSNTAFFSDVTVPGNVTTGNLGYNANFGAITGGLYHSGFSPLPVQLAWFTATALPSGGVRLDWMTLSEVNNFGFYVQRKAAPEATFVDLLGGFVPGHRTTIEPQSYTYTDLTAPAGTLFYRLRQVDLDGTVHYSHVISVDVITTVQGSNVPTEYALHQNYPNPFNPNTVIRYDLPEAADVTLILYNALGQEVQMIVRAHQNAGHHTAAFDASSLASGVYVYRLKANGFAAVRKLMVIK